MAVHTVYLVNGSTGVLQHRYVSAEDGARGERVSEGEEEKRSEGARGE